VHVSTLLSCFLVNSPTPSDIYPLSLHDALPILRTGAGFTDQVRAVEELNFGNCIAVGEHAGGETDVRRAFERRAVCWRVERDNRSEEHTSELQSPDHLVCRLLLEKKKTQLTHTH